MSISDKARKIAQSFLTLDDLVLGQSLTTGGLGNLGKVGFSSSGPSVALNVASRVACLGAQVATRAAKVPLPGEAAKLAGKMSDQAKALGERCSNLAVQGIEMAGGNTPQNPITKEEWLNKRATPGYTPGELAADTVFGTLQDLTMLPIAAGMDTLRRSSKTKAADRIRTAVDATLDKVPDGAIHAHSAGLRQGLAALALESGMPLAQTTVALSDAAARLAFSDTRALREEMLKGLARAQLLAKNEQAPASSKLRETAKKLSHHPPEQFLAALERGPNGKAPSQMAILRALIKDWRALSIFSTMYPQMMGLLGTDLMSVLVGGPAGKSPFNSAESNGHDDTSATFAVLDSLVGSAVTEDGATPLFSRATVYLAQDLSFLTHRDKHGRDSALERAERLFGAQVRDRIAADVSLDAKIMGVADSPLPTRIREFISSVEDANDLSRQIDRCSERLALLECSESSARFTMTDSLTDRIDTLRLFTSLAACDLALRGKAAGGPDREAKSAFLAWAAEQP